MNRIIAVLMLVAFAITANAVPIKLGWDASPGSGITYVVKSWNFTTNAATGVRTRTTIKQSFPSVSGLVQDVNLPVGEHVVTVQAIWTPMLPSEGTIESDPSNDLVVLVPAAPGNLKIVKTVVSNGMRLDVFGDKAKRVTLYRDNGNGKWKEIHVFKNFDGQDKFVDKNWTKKKDFDYKVEVS